MSDKANHPSAATSPQPILVRNHGTPTLFAEGLSQLLLGYPISRLVLHGAVQRDTSNPEAPEVREVACELAMPTAALVEMARHILTAASTSQSELAKVGADSQARMQLLIGSVAISSLEEATVGTH